MAKIALELDQAVARRVKNGFSGNLTAHVLAEGEGWTVSDMVCTAGPQDRPFEERHSCVAIALVAAGSFQYSSAAGREMMTPGSLLLGNPGQSFECGHEHAAGDRCLAFQYTPDYFESLAAHAGTRRAGRRFGLLRLPPLRAMSPLVARACAGLAATPSAVPISQPQASSSHSPPGPYGAITSPLSWEELSVQLAVRTLELAGGVSYVASDAPPSAVARVTRTVRMIERHPDTRLALAGLAREAGLSPYHFLRVFERLTGVTPHQYILRMRLREAAMRLAAERAKVLDIALDCGFGDLSNFNRAFRAEFGVSPRRYRMKGADGSAKWARPEHGALYTSPTVREA